MGFEGTWTWLTAGPAVAGAVIAAAPFRDRVVHHAVLNVVEPALDRAFIRDSYACRVGKGVHAAVDRYQGWAQRFPYVLKMDVQRCFPSIDHALLEEKLGRRIKDRRVLALLGRIIASAPPPRGAAAHFPGDDLLTPLSRPTGIPIGNLTSQFFANLYLDGLDHLAGQGRRGPGLVGVGRRPRPRSRRGVCAASRREAASSG